MKITPEKVSVIGIGDFHSRQYFEQGSFHPETLYFSGLKLEFRVLTTHLHSRIDFEKGYAELLINYELYTGEDLVQTAIKAITIDCD